MADVSYRDWPFLTDQHRDHAARLETWAAEHIGMGVHPHTDIDNECRTLVRKLGAGGWLAAAVPAAGAAAIDVRTLCLSREILARYSGLADFAFAMQGLGTGAITLYGDDALKARILPAVRAGHRIAAFALSEPDAGSDVAALTTSATRTPNGWRIDGEKTWISNGGIAHQYVVFARTGEAPGARGLTAFVVEADNPGLTIANRIDVIAPHPLATLRFENCVIPDSDRLGAPGEGFKVAMSTLDIFRPTVGAAALGFARRAMDEATHRANTRMMFGAPLATNPLTQSKIADMALAIDTSALLVYRAAWTRDTTGRRITSEAAMAKLHATESAQHVIDAAVQIFGGLGVKQGIKVEELYREIRALRIYEGATEVQKLIIARSVLAGG